MKNLVKLELGRVWLAAVLALALILLANHEARLAGATADQQPPAGPSLIDWQTYTTAFNKKYSSWRQTLVRQNLFTVKQLQVFITAAKYKLNPRGYYMVINEYSDLTPEEERRKMSGDHEDDDDDDDRDGAGNDADGPMDDEAVRQLLMAELDEAGIAYDKRKPDAARLATAKERQRILRQQLKQKQKQKEKEKEKQQHKHPHKRSTDEQTLSEIETNDVENKRDLSLDDLVRIPDASHSNRDEFDGAYKIQWVVPSNNPDYQPPEQMTMGIGFDTPDQAPEKVEDVPEEDIEKIEKTASSWLASVSSYLPNLGVCNFLSGSAKSTVGWFRSKSFKWREQQSQSLGSAKTNYRMTKVQSGEGQQVVTASSQTESRVIKDWRETGCISPPIHQGQCMSCYAVAAISHLEWSFCMYQERTITPLSIQYLLSCGPQMRQESGPKANLQLYGCDRGRSLQAMTFIKEYGAELAAHMPYLARDTPCPVDPGTPRRNKGYLRPNVKQPVRMYASTTQLDLALKVGPVIVNFHQPYDFFAYGGGMVGRCHPHGSHAMLIVGHGIENGKPYLIIKNSFGTNWGMRGYFKFDREYTTECVKDFVLPRFSFPSKKSQARHMKAYLADRQESKTGEDLSLSHQENSVPNLDKMFDTDASGLL